MKKICTLLVSSLMVMSCQQSTTADDSSKKKEEKNFEMYSMSDMSLVMERMYVENERLKASLEKGEKAEAYKDFFEQILDAETTKQNQIDEFYTQHAKLFLEAQKAIFNQQTVEQQKVQFNKSVDACIQCHEVKCQGPIDRIQNLYIN